MEKITVNIDPDLKTLIPGFMENRRMDIAQLKQASQDHDLEKIAFIAHTLKGTGSGYGFKEISSLGERLEYAVKQRDLKAIDSLVDSLEQYLRRVDIVM